jgi:hypothetical protein
VVTGSVAKMLLVVTEELNHLRGPG